MVLICNSFCCQILSPSTVDLACLKDLPNGGISIAHSVWPLMDQEGDQDIDSRTCTILLEAF